MNDATLSLRSLLRIFSCFSVLAALAVALSTAGMSQTIKDVATDATDPNNLADTEPSITVNPANPLEIAIVSFSESWGVGVKAPVWRSTDGGLTWTKVPQIPQPPSNQAGPGDQKTAFDATGKLLIAELDFIPKDYVYRQTGLPSAPLTAGAQYGNDQPHLEVDRTPASPCFNRVYSPYLDTAASPNRSHVVWSSDFGATVHDVAVGSTAFPNRTTRIAVAPNGKVYVVYKTREGAVDSNFENAHFRVMRSDDCGVTWGGLGATGTPVHSGAAVTWFTNNFGNPLKGKVARARSSDDWIAVDPSSGDIYVAFVNKDASGFGQIFVARSTNQGATWSGTRVTGGTHHSAYPEIAVAANGVIAVLYVDFDDSGAHTIFSHRLARSFNHNVSWSSVDLQSMDPGPISNASSGFLWGDYEGITAAGNEFYGVFTGQSIGRTVLQLDPIFFKAPAFQLINICAVYPQICKGLCTVPGCLFENPLEKICAAGGCPICPGGGCPFFNLILEELGDPWRVQILDPQGKPVQILETRTAKGVIVSFRPDREFANRIGEYKVVFRGAKAGLKFDIKPKLEFSEKPMAAPK